MVIPILPNFSSGMQGLTTCGWVGVFDNPEDSAASGAARTSPQSPAVSAVSPTLRCVSTHPAELTLLTSRQLEVLRHLARGDSVKEIARQMHLSQKSVDSHKYRIMSKLGIHDRVELARFAIREGLMLP